MMFCRLRITQQYAGPMFAAIWLMCVASSAVDADEYYVDATHGNDVFSGKSPATPWQTLTKASAQTFSEG